MRHLGRALEIIALTFGVALALFAAFIALQGSAT